MIWAARLLSFFTGFLSLSQEILWVRLAGFSYHGAPQAFGVILGLYLLGIAVGAGIGKRYCRSDRNLFLVAAVILFVAAAGDVLFPWLTVSAFGLGSAAGAAMLFVSVLVTSMIKSKIFPIAHHIGSSAQADTVGSSVSKVYFANIVGSTLGPLVTGFVLLQVLTLQQCLMLMAGLTLLTGAYCWQIGRSCAIPGARDAGGGRQGKLVLAGSALVTVLLFFIPGTMIGRLVENTGNHEGPFKSALENRYGIIHLLDSPDGDDYVFGGNAYDGRINIDFMRNTNWISRLYMLAALKPHPERVLVIGMSAGSWTRVISAFPGVKKIDVIEINPGYTEITARYAEVKPILIDPRITIHFDDGRRWLKRHPGEKYDLVVMNTTFHWRAYITMLLSREFIGIVKEHMNPGALLAYNSTFSWDVFKTASTVFSTVYAWGNFVITGDGIALPDEEEAMRRVAALRLDGQPLLDPAKPEVRERLRESVRQFEPYADIEKKAGRPLEVITDQNMLTEYKYGQSIFGFLGGQKK